MESVDVTGIVAFGMVRAQWAPLSSDDHVVENGCKRQRYRINEFRLVSRQLCFSEPMKGVGTPFRII